MLAPGVAYQCLTHFRGKSQEHKKLLWSVTQLPVLSFAIFDAFPELITKTHIMAATKYLNQIVQNRSIYSEC